VCITKCWKSLDIALSSPNAFHVPDAVDGTHQIEKIPARSDVSETSQVSLLLPTLQGVLLPFDVLSVAMASRIVLASSTLPPAQNPYTDPPGVCFLKEIHPQSFVVSYVRYSSNSGKVHSVWLSGKLLLALASTVIFSFGPCETHDAIFFIFSLLSLFWKNRVGLWDHTAVCVCVCVCVCISPYRC
jgi:hypothetical protein